MEVGVDGLNKQDIQLAKAASGEDAAAAPGVDGEAAPIALQGDDQTQVVVDGRMQGRVDADVKAELNNGQEMKIEGVNVGQIEGNSPKAVGKSGVQVDG